MRIDRRIRITPTEEELGLLKDLGHVDHEASLDPDGSLEIILPDRSDDARELLAGLAHHGIRHTAEIRRAFTRREIRSASALRIEPTATRTDRNRRAEAVCPLCERHGEFDAESPVVDPDLVAGCSMARGDRGEIFVDERVAIRMIRDRISGAILREVERMDDRPWIDGAHYQLIPTHRLPPSITPPTRFSVGEGVCPTCGRGGIALDSMLYYDLEIERLDDINVTLEVFGTDRTLAPEMVVTPRFYNLLVSCGMRVHEPEPVVFV